MTELAVVCFKWGEGYPALHANVLRRAVADHLSMPHRFVCLTDAPQGLDAETEALPLPEIPLPRERWVPGMWPKLAVFRPGLFAPGTTVLMLDVDIVLAGPLDPLVQRVREMGGLHIIADWPDSTEHLLPKRRRPVRLSNSSVVGFTAGEQDRIWTGFEADPERFLAYGNDQRAIHFEAAGRQHWPEGWVLSFKKQLAWHVPVNLVRPVPRPEGAAVVAFHGKPDPEDLAQAPFRRWGSREKWGIFPVPWVRDYWRRYAGNG